MKEIIFERLSDENFSLESMDTFIRFEKISQVWKMVNGKPTLADANYIMDWNLEKRRGIAQLIHRGIQGDYFAYGAFYEGRVVGYILVSKKPFGSSNQYIELALFHISAPYRGKGIGKQLFKLACLEAKSIGAKKLYISAGPAVPTQAAYQKFGCVPAVEINPEATERAPLDIQLEYLL